MTAGWVAIWRGKSFTCFLNDAGEWDIDACNARVFSNWASARVAAGLMRGISIVRGWT